MKKKIFLTIILICAISYCGLNINKISDKLADLMRDNPKVVLNKPNEYFRNTNYGFVKESKDFIPYSYQDLLDIFYSVLDRGYDVFTFYCPDEYTECLNDIDDISENQDLLTHINNYVHPFNNFSNIETSAYSSGKVSIKVTKLYSTKEINDINSKIDSIISSVLTNEMSVDDKILTIHDFIVNNSKYDVNKKDNTSTYKSNIAYGPLLEGYAVCGGYADAMAIFLNKFNVPNFKIATPTHVWNAVYINDEWLHLDLTWDDPSTENSDKDTLLHKFYLIKNDKLEGYKISDHDFDKTIYQEFAS